MDFGLLKLFSICKLKFYKILNSTRNQSGLLCLLLFCSVPITPLLAQDNYLNNRAPLKRVPYVFLPIGAIQPHGFLRMQLDIMKKGSTGNLDERYASVIGKRNAWLGGDGDGWERGPYWIDGLLPLAYILKDSALIRKVQPWVEWTLTHQDESGYIGPKPSITKPVDEPGIQKEPREDWWPRMVMLKVLQQYYNATNDDRVIKVLAKYFRYQLQELPKTPIDHWSFWGNRRAADNLLVVYWLYNITGESYLLDLAQIIHDQTFPYTSIFNKPYQKSQGIDHLYPYNTGNRYPFDKDLIGKLHVGQLQSFHCVNIAQGIKSPVIYYQQHSDTVELRAAKNAMRDLETFHGQAQGMFGGDEPLHGNLPTQGVELCAVVEMMYSLENMTAITGDVEYADRLEKIAYNALPTQTTDDFNSRQYFQSANQVQITRGRRNFFEDDNHGGTDLCFGLVTGYPCCTCNMHQGWPKFVQNLWLATEANGLAALVYGASEVTAKAGRGVVVNIKEETNYPFDEKVTFLMNPSQSVSFPFQLRIPGWCKQARITINGEMMPTYKAGTIATINRLWKRGDKVELLLPMAISTKRWLENSVSVERGPLVYALRIEENWNRADSVDAHGSFYEVTPGSPWNFGLLNDAVKDPVNGFKVVKNIKSNVYPWNLPNAPIVLKVKGKLLPDWKLYNNMPGPLPHSSPSQHYPAVESSEVTLVPYGCSTLRISEFPVVE